MIAKWRWRNVETLEIKNKEGKLNGSTGEAVN